MNKRLLREAHIRDMMHAIDDCAKRNDWREGVDKINTLIMLRDANHDEDQTALKSLRDKYQYLARINDGEQ